jgi:hypothetical protein
MVIFFGYLTGLKKFLDAVGRTIRRNGRKIPSSPGRLISDFAVDVNMAGPTLHLAIKHTYLRYPTACCGEIDLRRDAEQKSADSLKVCQPTTSLSRSLVAISPCCQASYKGITIYLFVPNDEEASYVTIHNSWKAASKIPLSGIPFSTVASEGAVS